MTIKKLSWIRLAMPKPRYKPLVDRLAAQIRSGTLPPGTRLPPHRQLAANEGLALVTASRVYAELEAMGLVSCETGRGTFVRETALAPGLGIDQKAMAVGMADLNFNYPALPGQAEILRQGLRQLATHGDLEALLRYQPHAGRPHEREIFARHLRNRGLGVSGERLLIVNGAQQGLAVALMALLQPGDVIAADALTYSGFKILAQALRLEVVPIPVLDQGPDLDALEALCHSRRVKAVYAMPTLHNPLGWVMGLQQRERLAQIARDRNLLIVEDAAYAFLVQSPPAPLASLAPERTVYVSGLSKSIATGLRVGFMVAPAEKIEALERVIRATTWNTPGVMTALATLWVEDGTLDRLEAQKRQDAQARQAIAREALVGLPWRAHPHAYFLWLPLAEEARADRVAMALLREQVAVSTAEPFAIGPHVPHALRLALGSVEKGALRAALEKVKWVVEAHV